MKALIFANFDKEKSYETLLQTCEELTNIGIIPTMECFSEKKIHGVFYGEREKLIKECDVIITIGGDGTILRYAKLASEARKPLLGINTGRLGFMATLESNELYKLSRLNEKKYTLSNRMLLDITFMGKTYLALNDVVLINSRNSRLPEFCVSVDNHEMTRVRADGIIFSTPTGSTAYSLSAGGPIIQPDANCIEFTPLCAHTLFNRPIIFSADSEVTISFSESENSSVIMSVDGNNDIELTEGETLHIKKSKRKLSIIDINEGSFYTAVHDKLMRPLK